eukprot:TRINITY_DN6718_c0_g1_i2.p1 TRINITY_DN6718_c0_g1~~TRINITY_DN6718_c0_g1_i2.p1  ORF type:complete len:167 (+),score=26.30 TRINITY_DN6718_c0_g1_i2:141-641(+)
MASFDGLSLTKLRSVAPNHGGVLGIDTDAGIEVMCCDQAVVAGGRVMSRCDVSFLQSPCGDLGQVNFGTRASSPDDLEEVAVNTPSCGRQNRVDRSTSYGWSDDTQVRAPSPTAAPAMRDPVEYLRPPTPDCGLLRTETAVMVFESEGSGSVTGADSVSSVVDFAG